MTLGPALARTPLPQGFRATGAIAGVRRYRPDLGVIVSDEPALTVGYFGGSSPFVGAHVNFCRSILPSRDIRAVVTTSGQANVATGAEGQFANREIAFEAAKELVCYPRQVLVNSTGVIGETLDYGKIVPAVAQAIPQLEKTAESFALSILTTDLLPKVVSTSLELKQGRVRITGICKGSTLLYPNMPTRLFYIMTDVALDMDFAQNALDLTAAKHLTETKYATCDTALFMANGASGAQLSDNKERTIFMRHLNVVAKALADAIESECDEQRPLEPAQQLGKVGG